MSGHDSKSPEGLWTECILTGTLRIFVAFDWGERVDLEIAQSVVPAELHQLNRRRRTPSSFLFRPPPLRFDLPALPLELPPLGSVSATAVATLFDFGAVSLAMAIPFQVSPADLSRLAGHLADPDQLIVAARAALEPLHRQLLPAIHQSQWSDRSEEYFVIEMPRGGPLPNSDQLLEKHAAWVAGLVRLETEPLSSLEIAEALKHRLSYRPDDLFVGEWSAALLIDSNCDETLSTIELANVQLLEFRHIDDRLDARLEEAYALVHPLSRSWLPFWRTHARPLRTLGDMKIEANDLYERTANVLKLVGDPYLARIYRLLAQRFHLDDLGTSIHRSLQMVEGVYHVLSDQAATYRAELLEIIIVMLIAVEIGLALAGKL